MKIIDIFWDAEIKDYVAVTNTGEKLEFSGRAWAELLEIAKEDLESELYGDEIYEAMREL